MRVAQEKQQAAKERAEEGRRAWDPSKDPNVEVSLRLHAPSLPLLALYLPCPPTPPPCAARAPLCTSHAHPPIQPPPHPSSHPPTHPPHRPASLAPQQGDPFKTLFVGRLSYDVTERKLRRELEEFGPVKRVRLVHDKHSGGWVMGWWWWVVGGW